MGKLSKDKEEALAFIDSILTMLEMEENSIYPSIEGGVSVSPMKFLLKILNRLGVSNDEIVDFIAKFLVQAAPILEYTLKGLLISKFKSDIDCNLDPRIPDKYRENEDGGIFIYSTDDRGFKIDMNIIDYKGLLNLCPIAKEGRFYYFGTSKYYYIDNVDEKFYTYNEVINYVLKNGLDSSFIKKYAEVENIEELIRANDFNAFLWYVVNKCKVVKTPQVNDGVKCLEWTEGLENYSIGQVFQNGHNYAMIIKSIDDVSSGINLIEPPTSNNSNKIITQEEIESEINKNNNVSKSYTLSPYGNLLTGLNWYVNRNDYFSFNKKERDYKNEFALFNIAPILGSSEFDKKVSIRIKAKPNYYLPKVNVNFTVERNEKINNVKVSYSGDNLKTMRKLLFNAQGESDKNGRFSVKIGEEKKYDENTKIRKYSIQNSENIFLNIDTINGTYYLSSGGDVKDFSSVLYECYQGLTVYEFNYDMVMGIKFFDPKVLAAQLIEAICNISIGLNWNNLNDNYDRIRIVNVIKKMLNSESSSFSDCFYSFSNEEFETMLNESENKRASLYPFNTTESSAIKINSEDILNILNEYKDTPQFENENIEVLKRSFTQASASINTFDVGVDRYNIQKDFLLNCIEAIAVILVETLFSPKVFMIMEMNNQLLGRYNEKQWDLDYIIKAFGNVIMSYVNEIKDMIIKHLFKLVEEKIKVLLEGAATIILKEQIEYYTRLMNALLKACRFSRQKSKNIDSILDNVDYADIDEVTYNGEEC